jgi:hypothetical protein
MVEGYNITLVPCNSFLTLHGWKPEVANTNMAPRSIEEFEKASDPKIYYVVHNIGYMSLTNTCLIIMEHLPKVASIGSFEVYLPNAQKDHKEWYHKIGPYFGLLTDFEKPEDAETLLQQGTFSFKPKGGKGTAVTVICNLLPPSKRVVRLTNSVLDKSDHEKAWEAASQAWSASKEIMKVLSTLFLDKEDRTSPLLQALSSLSLTPLELECSVLWVVYMDPISADTVAFEMLKDLTHNEELLYSGTIVDPWVKLEYGPFCQLCKSFHHTQHLCPFPQIEQWYRPLPISRQDDKPTVAPPTPAMACSSNWLDKANLLKLTSHCKVLLAQARAMAPMAPKELEEEETMKALEEEEAFVNMDHTDMNNYHPNVFCTLAQTINLDSCSLSEN